MFRSLAPAGLRVLKLHHNIIVDATPLVPVVDAGKLAQLHLSHNHLNAKSLHDLVVAAVGAKDDDGRHCYPLGDSVPLWLRLEFNRQSPQTSERLSMDIAASLSRLGRPLWRSVCVVSGQTECCPGQCRQKPNTPPALHLTYMDFHAERRLDPKTTQKRRGNDDCCQNRCGFATHVPRQTRVEETCAIHVVGCLDEEAFPPLELAASQGARRGKSKKNKRCLIASSQTPAEHGSNELVCNLCADAAPTAPAAEHTPTCKVAIANYEAESYGFLSVAFGNPVFVHSEDFAGAVGCHFARYFFGENGRTNELGWFPNIEDPQCI